jgi:hypothetical protein
MVLSTTLLKSLVTPLSRGTISSDLETGLFYFTGEVSFGQLVDISPNRPPALHGRQIQPVGSHPAQVGGHFLGQIFAAEPAVDERC